MCQCGGALAVAQVAVGGAAAGGGECRPRRCACHPPLTLLRGRRWTFESGGIKQWGSLVHTIKCYSKRLFLREGVQAAQWGT